MTCFFWAAAAAVVPALGEEGISGAVRSEVSVDRRTGRLVRRIVVPENVIAPRVVSARAPALPRASIRGGNEKVDQLVEEMAGEHRVDPLLVHAIIHVESRYDRFAVSPKGAEGLMQLIPPTARRLGVKNSFDSRQNIEGGVKYLRQLQERFSDLRLVLAAYNAGEHAVERWRGIPPYAETQDYVYKVGRRYGELRRSQKPAPAPKPELAKAARAEPEHRPLESFVDPEGRLHLRTR